MNVLNWETRLSDHLRSSTRGKKADIGLDQALGKIEETSLVIDRDDSCGDVSIRPTC